MRRVGTAITELNATCASIRSHVAASKRETGLLLEESNQLMVRKHQIDSKQSLLSSFTSHFLLSEAELVVSTSTAEPITPAFFDALARLKQIHRDCQTLLTAEDQTLGLEVLERSTQHLDAAFQKLYRWTRQELKSVDLENPQLSAPIRRAISVLAERPALFQSCLDYLADTREQTLANSFYTALTGELDKRNPSVTTVSTSTKAIEMNAHDPLRYVSDMLAWVHAAAVSEREALQTLFVSDADAISQSLRTGHQSQPWLQSAGLQDTPEVFDGKKTLDELVDRDLGGVMRQLRQRLEQSLYSHDDALLAYQIRNLVAFYCTVLRSSLGGHESQTESTLRPVVDMAMAQFQSIMKEQIANAHVDVSSAPRNLSTPEFLSDALTALKALIKSYETSLGGSESHQQRVDGLTPVIEAALDPYLVGCENMTQTLDAPNDCILKSNYLGATRDTLSESVYLSDKLDELNALIREQEHSLVDFTHSSFVTGSGMQSLISALSPHSTADSRDKVQTIAKLPVLKTETLTLTSQRLDAFLPTAMEDARNTLDALNDKSMLRRICETAADRFSEQFELVERLLERVDGLKEETDENELLLRDIFPRTGDEIRVLLS